MAPEQKFDVKLENGKVVEWTGVDGPDAMRRAADCLGVAAVAWRYPTWDIVQVHHSQIIG